MGNSKWTIPGNFLKAADCLRMSKKSFNNLLSLNSDISKKKVQAQVIERLSKGDYSLNVVNRYKENIVHVSAANNCIDIIRWLLQKHDKHCLERKNAFGWTPLMHAVRNENIDMVKFLLDSGAIVNDFSFLGMSVLTLSCAISSKMFDLVYTNCPSALEYAAHDDIDPLCVAALKNDKKLFFKLINLGLEVNKANAFTHTMMKRSTVPEIVALAKPHLNSEDYWTDLSDIEDLLNTVENNNNNNNGVENKNITNSSYKYHDSKVDIFIPKICVEETICETVKHRNFNSNNNNNLFLNFKPIEDEGRKRNLISPTLSYFKECTAPVSPNTFITEDNQIHTFTKLGLDDHEADLKIKVNNNKNKSFDNLVENNAPFSPLVLRRCQDRRPPNLKLRSSSNDSNVTLSYTPQFSPSKTPNLPHNVSEDNVFDETTPTPPKYKTPPRGIIFDPSTAKLMLILQRFGLKRHIPMFIEQEVDMDLFLTLTDNDLTDIGIDSKSERLILLSVINECKGSKI